MAGKGTLYKIYLVPLEFPNIINRSKLYKQGKSYRSHTRAIKSVCSYLAFCVRTAKCLTSICSSARTYRLTAFCKSSCLSKAFTVLHCLSYAAHSNPQEKRILLLKNDSCLIVSGFIGTIGMEIFRQTYPLKIMKSAILPHSMEVITLVFFAYSNQSLAGIFRRMFWLIKS